MLLGNQIFRYSFLCYCILLWNFVVCSFKKEGCLKNLTTFFCPSSKKTKKPRFALPVEFDLVLEEAAVEVKVQIARLQSTFGLHIVKPHEVSEAGGDFCWEDGVGKGK